MMSVVNDKNTDLKNKKIKLKMLENQLLKDTNEKDIKYHSMAISTIKSNIKKLENQ